ncbi:hypothetical protein EMIT0P44_380037 [Pseudomonas sp. IT-P44]
MRRSAQRPIRPRCFPSSWCSPSTDGGRLSIADSGILSSNQVTGWSHKVARGAFAAYGPNDALLATGVRWLAAGCCPSRANFRKEVTTCRTTPALPCLN